MYLLLCCLRLILMTIMIIITINNNQKYPPKEVLCGGWLFQEYNEKAICSFLAHLNVDNMRTQVVCKEFKGVIMIIIIIIIIIINFCLFTINDNIINTGKTSEVEKWYKTEYNQSKFDADLVKVLL